MSNTHHGLSDIQMMHIGKIDMNLLRVFAAIYRTGNVSRASDELGLTQPATSRALGKLRVALKDALFVRVQVGVEPTPKARRLAEPIAAAIAALENALVETENFDPRTTCRNFRLHLTDTGESLVLPGLIARLATVAPYTQLHSVSMHREEIADSLDGGRLDFAIGYLPGLSGTQATGLFTDRHVIVLREGHPLLTAGAGSIAPAKLSSLEFVLVRPHLETTRILQSLGLADRTRVTTSHFLALPEIIKNTDLGAWMPKRVACKLFPQTAGYGMVEPETTLADFAVTLHWSKRFENDAPHAWLRGQLQALLAEG